MPWGYMFIEVFYWLFLGHSFSSAVPVPPAGWPVPPRPQPWYPQHAAVSIPPPAAVGYAQQPLFPVQNVRPPLASSTSPALQPSPVVPPGMPSSTPPVTVSQPLFPVVNNNTTSQSSLFSAPIPSTSIALSSSAEIKGSVDAHSSANTSVTNSYHVPSMQGLIILSLIMKIFLFTMLCLIEKGVSFFFFNFSYD